MQMQHVQYTRGLGDWNVQTASADALMAGLMASWSREDHHVCEYLEEHFITRPFFDFDHELPEAPTSQQLQLAHSRCERAIRQMFGPDPDFDYETDVVCAHRHGFVPAKGLYKISFRYWIRGFCLPMGHIPWLIRACASPDTVDVFDLTIYSKRRLMAVVGACKGRGDHRVLDMDDRTHARWTLCQVLEGDERQLDMSDEIKATPYGESKGTAPPDWRVLEAALVQAGFRDPVCVGRRAESITIQAGNLGVDCPCCPNVHDSQNWWVMAMADGRTVAKSYSARCKAKTIMVLPCEDIVADPLFVEDMTQNVVDVADNSFMRQALVKVFDTQAVQGLCLGCDADTRECHHVRQHLESCPTCFKRHHEDLWYVYEPLKSCWTMRNSAFNCKERLLPLMLNPYLENISNNAQSDADYADLFVSEHRGQYISDGNVILHFTGLRWKVVKDQSMQSTVQEWLRPILKQLYLLFDYEITILKQTHAPQPPTVRKYSRMYWRIDKYLSKEGTVKTLLCTLKRKLLDEELWAKMDADPHLLGLENGVIDLRSGDYRAQTREDMISCSVGYDWNCAVDADIEENVERFFEQLYPVPDERRMAMLFGGYALTGSHPEKKWLTLSDQIGGWNGKSTFIKALRAVLGDEYSMEGVNAFLYRTDNNNETVNSHSAGLLSHKGKRLVTFEELDPKRQLNGGLLKTINGVCPQMTGRACHSGSVEKFEWKAKMVMAYNQSSMPEFDWTDSALISRMLIVHHRSKFCESQEQLLEDNGTPHVFLADPNLDEKLRLWRPYILRFFLKGCKLYFAEGFTKVPETCVQWRKELVRERDTVGAFVEDNLQRTGNDIDFVERASMYRLYADIYPEERNRKTALGKRKWFDQLQKVLGEDGFHELQRTMPDGSKRRQSWSGWKMLTG